MVSVYFYVRQRSIWCVWE